MIGPGRTPSDLNGSSPQDLEIGRSEKRVAWGSALESLCAWSGILRWAPRGFSFEGASGLFFGISDWGDFFGARATSSRKVMAIPPMSSSIRSNTNLGNLRVLPSGGILTDLQISLPDERFFRSTGGVITVLRRQEGKRREKGR